MKPKVESCSAEEGAGTLPEWGEFWSESLERLNTKLQQEMGERRRAQCMAKIQSHAVQLTLDLLVREPDPDNFFRVLLKALLDQTESQTCGVWRLDDDSTQCEPWMAYLGERF